MVKETKKINIENLSACWWLRSNDFVNSDRFTIPIELKYTIDDYRLDEFWKRDYMKSDETRKEEIVRCKSLWTAFEI